MILSDIVLLIGFAVNIRVLRSQVSDFNKSYLLILNEERQRLVKPLPILGSIWLIVMKIRI